MNSSAMMRKLFSIPFGSKICVIYESGGKTSPRATREARRSAQAGIPRNVYFGKLHVVRRTQEGQIIMTILCSNRDDLRTGKREAYRTFNPSKGRLVAIHPV